MGNQIEFLNWDQDHFNEDRETYLFKRKEKMIQVAKRKSEKSYYLFKNSIRWVIYDLLNDETKDVDRIQEYFKYSMQAIYAYINTFNSEIILNFWIGNDQVQLEKHSDSFANVATLKEFINFATITRCSEVINTILELPLESEIIDNVNMISHFTYSIYFLERSFKTISQDTLNRLLNDIDSKAAKEYKNDKEFGGWYSECLVPLNQLREAFFLGNEEEFNNQLKITLDKNRAYFDNKENNRFRDMENWLPWDIIAYACRAYDKGWKITVEDSRLPMFLVEGKCNVTTLAPE